MARKKKTNTLTKAGSYTLGDLKTSDTLRVDPWAMEDPSKSYEANACDVLVEGSELVISFAQTVPGSQHVVTAISISIPVEDVRAQIGTFGPIQDRLEARNFSEEDVKSRQLERKKLEDVTVQNYRRESAQIIRAICSDHLAVLDFYRRPIISRELVDARPQAPLTMEPVIRLRCPAEVLSLWLRLVNQVLQEEDPDE